MQVSSVAEKGVLPSLLLENVETMCIDVLMVHTQREIKLFLEGHKHTAPATLELFKRSLGGGRESDAAWVYLLQQFGPLVTTWVERYDYRGILLAWEGRDGLVNEIFSKFARSVTPEKLPMFTEVPPLITYLKKCTRSVFLDHMREWHSKIHVTVTWDHLKDAQQELVQFDVAEEVEASVSAEELWNFLRTYVLNEREFAVLSLLYQQGMKPADIFTLLPNYCVSVQEVCNMKRNVLARLQRSRVLKGYLDHQG